MKSLKIQLSKTLNHLQKTPATYAKNANVSF